MADLGNTISLNASNFAAGIAQARAKLTELNTALVENRNKMKELNAEAKKLEQQEKELAKEMKNGGTAEQREQLQQLRDRIAQVNSEIGSLRTREQELKHDISETNRELQEQREKAGGLSDAFSQLGQLFAGLGIAEACYQIADAFGECVRAASDFEATMSTVEALSSATASQMEELTDKAKNLGATTKFTATEAAQAMTFMGMAGWDATQMLDGMDGVLQLAAASGTDLATTADIITDAMTAFKIEAKDTAHFADVLAATATNSNTSVEIMGETFKNCASVAGALNYSIEDVSAAIGLMANSGVKGTVAGTALKNTFNGLLQGATLTSKAFGEVKITAVNADGTMKDFGNTINELRGYFSQMTEAERVTNAMDIAGKYGYNGLLAIVNSTQQDFDKLTDSINDCTGAASKMADVKMDNLSGQVTLMNSAMDALKNTIGSAYDDELKDIAKGFTDVLTGMNDFLSKNPMVTKSLLAMAAAATAMIGAFAAYTTINLATKALKALGVAAGTTLGAMAAVTAAVGAWTLVAQELTVAFGGVSESIKNLQEEQKKINDGIEDGIAANEAEMNLLKDKTERYEELRNTENRTSGQEAELKAIAEELQGTFGDDIQVINSLTGEYNDLTGAVDKYIDAQMREAKMSVYKDAVKKIYQQIEDAEQELKKKHDEWQKKTQSFDLFDLKHELARQSFVNDKNAIQDLIKDYKSQLEELSVKMSDLYEEGAEGTQNTTNSFKDTADAINQVGSAAEEAQKSVEDMRKEFDEMSKSANSLVSEYASLYDALNDLKNGEAINQSQLEDLLRIYPQLASHVTLTADGYIVESDALDELNTAIDNNLQASVNSQKEQTRVFIEQSKERLKAALLEYATYSAKIGLPGFDAESVIKTSELSEEISELAKEIAEAEAKYNSDYFENLTGAAQNGTSRKKTSSGGSSSKKPPGLSNITGYMKTATSAFKEMRESGELALSTVQALISAGYEEVLVYDEAADRWTLDTEKYEAAARAQINAAKGIEGVTNAEIKALDSLSKKIRDVTDGTYGSAKAILSLKDADSTMNTLSKAFAEQANSGLSAKTVSSLSDTAYGKSLVTVNGQVKLDKVKVSDTLKSELDKSISELEKQMQNASAEDIPALQAQIQAYKELRNAIDDVTAGIYGLEKSVVDDNSYKEAEKLANKRLDAINAELKAKQKLRDETLKAIDDEVQARKRLTEDNDIQRQIDQVTAQLKYSQLDDFSRRQLERRLQQLKNDQADLAWERSVEDRRLAASKEYDTAAEKLEAERDAIENSLSVLKELNKTTSDGFADLTDAIKEALSKTAAGRTINVSFPNAGNMSVSQIVSEVFRLLGADNVI